MFYQYYSPKIYETIYREIKKASYGFKKEENLAKTLLKR